MVLYTIMEDQKFIILSVLKNFLGEPKSSVNAETKVQWEFNCQSDTCRGDNKYNLAFNSDRNVFKCWKCKESGVVHKLAYRYGSKDDYSKLKLVLPSINSNQANVFRRKVANHNLTTCPLPEGFIPLNKAIKSTMHSLAYNYATEKRMLSRDDIDKFGIGYTEIGAYKNRLIIPSFNQNGDVNYFEARTFLKGNKLSYYKPDKKVFPKQNVPEKYDIIFNEYNINWDLPIYLVEGVFDMFRIPNSISMIGKTPSWLLLSQLIEHDARVVICLDEDAIKDGIEIYEKLNSVGLDVYFIDLSNKGDVSYVYEQKGQDAVTELLKSKKKIDFTFQLNKILNK